MQAENNILATYTDFSDRQKYTSLKTDDLHLWQFPFHAGLPLLDLCTSVLDAETLQKAKWFKFINDQNKYIIYQGILRLLIADYENLNTSDVLIGRSKKGKPYLVNDESFSFNMSDSGSMCVYVFARHCEVGVDIEEAKDLSDIDELIEKNLTQKEKDFINDRSERKSEYFFRFWTMKEAYLKAIGEGLRLAPENLEFSIENGQIKLLNQQGINEPEDWIFRDFYPKSSYFGTLVYKNEKTRIDHFIINQPK